MWTDLDLVDGARAASFNIAAERGRKGLPHYAWSTPEQAQVGV